MTVTIMIPTPLRPSVNGQEKLQFEASSVQEAINALVEQYPKVKQYVIDDKGELRKFVNFYINNTDIRDLNNAQSELNNGDILSIVPAIAGGLQ